MLHIVRLLDCNDVQTANITIPITINNIPIGSQEVFIWRKINGFG